MLTFETAPFFCVSLYYDFQVKGIEVGGTCRKHKKEGNFFTKFLSENMNGGGYLRGLEVERKILVLRELR